MEIATNLLYTFRQVDALACMSLHLPSITEDVLKFYYLNQDETHMFQTSYVRELPEAPRFVSFS